MAKKCGRPKRVIEEPQPEVKTRQRGDGLTCKECGGDMFVYKNRTNMYPEFMSKHIAKYYKCAACGNTDKSIGYS